MQGSGDCQSPAGRDLGQLLPLGSDVGSSSRGPSFSPGALHPAPESAPLDATQKPAPPRTGATTELSLKLSLVAPCNHWDKFSGDRRMQAS